MYPIITGPRQLRGQSLLSSLTSSSLLVLTSSSFLLPPSFSLFSLPLQLPPQLPPFSSFSSSSQTSLSRSGFIFRIPLLRVPLPRPFPVIRGAVTLRSFHSGFDSVIADPSIQHTLVPSRSSTLSSRLTGSSEASCVPMEPLRSAHPSQATAQPFTSSSSTSTLTPSSNLSSATSQSQPSNLFNLHPSNSTIQPFTAPLPASTCAAQSAMSQTQHLAQALSDPSHHADIPHASQGNTSESVPRSEAPPATQAAADIYPHEGNGFGGPTATAPFLQDFSLVAEAAKRAQMSIVMRDLESVTL